MALFNLPVVRYVQTSTAAHANVFSQQLSGRYYDDSVSLTDWHTILTGNQGDSSSGLAAQRYTDAVLNDDGVRQSNGTVDNTVTSDWTWTNPEEQWNTLYATQGGTGVQPYAINFNTISSSTGNPPSQVFYHQVGDAASLHLGVSSEFYAGGSDTALGLDLASPKTGLILPPYMPSATEGYRFGVVSESNMGKDVLLPGYQYWNGTTWSAGVALAAVSDVPVTTGMHVLFWCRADQSNPNRVLVFFSYTDGSTNFLGYVAADISGTTVTAATTPVQVSTRYITSGYGLDYDTPLHGSTTTRLATPMTPMDPCDPASIGAGDYYLSLLRHSSANETVLVKTRMSGTWDTPQVTLTALAGAAFGTDYTEAVSGEAVYSLHFLEDTDANTVWVAQTVSAYGADDYITAWRHADALAMTGAGDISPWQELHRTPKILGHSQSGTDYYHRHLFNFDFHTPYWGRNRSNKGVISLRSSGWAFEGLIYVGFVNARQFVWSIEWWTEAVTDTVVEPSPGSLQIQGISPEFLNPSIDFSFVAEPTAGSLLLEGQAPTFLAKTPGKAVVSAGSLLITGQTPVTTLIFTPEARLILRLTGGAQNLKPIQSLGGAASMQPGGVVIAQSAQILSGALPGVKIVGLEGASLGTHTLAWDPAAKALTWTDPSSVAVSVYRQGPLGIYQSSLTTGRIVVQVNPGQLAGASTSVTFAVSNTPQNMFDDVLLAERSVAHVNYRCMSIQNNTDRDLAPFELQLIAQPTYGALSLGSESPASPLIVQNSDGSSTELPSVLADEEDSTGLLSAVTFATSLEWQSLPARGFVSFWLKRTIAAGTSGTALTAEDFSFTITYGGA